MYRVLRSLMWWWRKRQYHAYLLSSDWWRVRTAVMMRDHWLCRKCGRPASQVHHKTYSHIFRESQNMNDLIAVCDSCHERLTAERRIAWST